MRKILKKLDIKSLKTSKVVNMEYMFSEGRKLEELNITNFQTSLVTNMNNMFSLYLKLTSLI